MRRPEATIFHKGERPGPDWHAHGVTLKYLWVFELGRLRWVLLAKQRWRHRDTGETVHDRPAWDRPHAPYGLDVVFAALATWLLGVLGLHKVAWPWDTEAPSRRTAQRWKVALIADAIAWDHALRLAGIELAAPRPLEMLFSEGGVPPPRTDAREPEGAFTACRLASALWTTEVLSRALSLPIRTLLVEARRRWHTAIPMTS